MQSKVTLINTTQRWEPTISANLFFTMEKRIRKRGLRFKQKLKLLGTVKEGINREKVFRRDNWTCYICKRKVRDLHNHPRMGTLDHVIPISKGGSHTYSNIKTCCAECNVRKGDK